MGKIGIIGKPKKQFRLYDIYRCATMNEVSCVEGIDVYDVNTHASVINVKYTDSNFVRHYRARNEDELKAIVKTINARLGNCKKPGPPKGTRYK